MKIMREAALTGALMLAAAPAAADEPIAAPADWGAALRADARAFHDIIADSHPGPVDAQNPGFTPLLERGLATALARAETAASYQDWYFALQEYAASFDDGHLSLYRYAPMGHVWRAEWPGFLTALRGDRHEVVFNRDAAAPPVGAVLVSCDGRPAEALAAEVAGRAAGRWNLRSRRLTYSTTLFVDQTNPYVRRAERCLFSVDGVETAWDLSWRDLPDAVRDEGFAAGRSPAFRTPIELRPWAGGAWIGLGGFNGDPASEDAVRLTALQAEIETRADAIRAAPAVVFDLRGNGGGSSAWINTIAATLWGEAWVEARAPRSQGVDWRTSAANLAQIESYKVRFADRPDTVAYMNRIADGLTAARAAGAPLWRQADGEGAAPAATAETAETAMHARTWVLTDYNCASACLDAVDLLTALGAVHVGQETSADTVYMEIRDEVLPGGRVTARVPMKVYRGRPRGSNETVVPLHVWSGELADTAGLEAWIAGLD